MTPRKATVGRAYIARILLVFLVAMLFAVHAGFAVEPNEMLDNPAHEARARAISKQLSCPVCSGETIDDSHSEIAKSMRLAIREQIQAGQSDDEILDYVATRYGERVLLHTPLNARTFALWVAPFVLLLLGGAVVWHVLATNRRAVAAEAGNVAAPLSEDETTALNRLLDDNDTST